jgi:hypothetical protein
MTPNRSTVTRALINPAERLYGMARQGGAEAQAGAAARELDSTGDVDMKYAEAEDDELPEELDVDDESAEDSGSAAESDDEDAEPPPPPPPIELPDRSTRGRRLQKVRRYA